MRYCKLKLAQMVKFDTGKDLARVNVSRASKKGVLSRNETFV